MSKFMVGLLMGVGIGLLVAPEKGEDTRESIAETAGNLKNTFNKLVGKAKTQLNDLKELLEVQVEGLDDDARARINAILEEAEMKEDGRWEFKPL
ncbi:MAG: YtxH domain-containing protein [Chitinophagaceae bacterium]